MRIVIELKRDANASVVLNQLYKHTQMQATFGAIMLALVNGVPQVLNLKQILQAYIDHRHEVITRRTQYDLDQALEREHLLEGLKIAVDHIDEVVAIIRGAPDVPAADLALRERFGLTEKQSKAILDMRLARLTALEVDKLQEELAEVKRLIGELKEILASRSKRMALLKAELAELVKKFGDDRRTEIVAQQGDFTVEDLIAEEDMVITISHAGYIKRTPVSTYRRQRRGGRGLNGMGTKEDDWVEHLFVASTHDYVLFFTQNGQVYWLKVYDIPQHGRAARGRPIVNLIQIKPGERIAAFVPVREFDDAHYLMFATANGTVKKTVLSAYGNPRSTGINAINIEDGDELIDVQVTDGTNDVVLATRHGMSIRFNERDAREMGRATTGVRGIELEEGDRVIGMVVIRRDATLLVVTEKGLGKRSELAEYRVQHRGGKGIITLKRTEKTGDIVALKEVQPNDELMLITRHGVVIRVPVDEIRVSGRNTQGVKIMNLDAGDTLVDVARVIREEGEDEEASSETPAALPGDELSQPELELDR
jgi:DNA gyrase subunit A